ncbi:sigma-54-dependent Fis family transcriptional regulator [Clostridium sp. CF012]|uniref:sigma-54 interaction domain-containing protein n=1 Tax=Clostridium sp. CF012 TaxID=2843319 RepID=UPI001C0D36D4|nr:sigma 54-interacting transcriptional regulator [Clostridium sp. CF012]MBU3145137.1 sigma 54-interacting transcriptional regulator [Clostridium sp. CF012]
MNFKFDEIKKLNDFENILITDEKGVVIFYDAANLEIIKALALSPDKFIGHKITSLYANLTDETSSIMNVLKTGVPICNKNQELITRKGNSVQAINSTYPLTEDNKVIGAIEFSKYFYTKESIEMLDSYSNHKIYRKNNTIYTIDDLITVNPKMLEIKKKISKISKTNSSVLIYGKTGTGKEVVAQAIHNMSERYTKPFISQNCGAIPATLLESILFGTVKGSFTGSNDIQGIFEQADGGTLFLDEINSLDIYLQVKLLKAIEEKIIRRIGGTQNIPLDIRIISATNECPEKMVSEKKLRDDLFYRLGVVQLNLPDLSERKEDIGGILNFYINRFNSTMNVNIKDIHPEVLDCFYKYNWPGNIRELKNAIETAYNNVSTTQITIDDIPERISKHISRSSEAPLNSTAKPLKSSIEEYEKQIIINELQNSNNRFTETARKLGISKQLLKYKIEKYELK